MIVVDVVVGGVVLVMVLAVFLSWLLFDFVDVISCVLSFLFAIFDKQADFYCQ